MDTEHHLRIHIVTDPPPSKIQKPKNIPGQEETLQGRGLLSGYQRQFLCMSMSGISNLNVRNCPLALVRPLSKRVNGRVHSIILFYLPGLGQEVSCGLVNIF